MIIISTFLNINNSKEIKKIVWKISKEKDIMELENVIMTKKIIIIINTIINNNNNKSIMIILIILAFQIMISSLVKINQHLEKIVIKKIKIKKLIKLFKVLVESVMLIKVVSSLKIIFN